MKEKHPHLFGTSLIQVLDILFPIFLHYMIFQLIAMVRPKFMDAGTLTTMAALLTLPIVLLMYRKEEKPQKNMKWITLWIPFMLGILGNVICSVILNLVRITEIFSNETQEALFQSHPVIQFIGLGLLVPVVEELIFRGLVWGKIKKYFGKTAAVLFSALLFAVYHGNVIQMLYAFPMGILLALVYGKWGKIEAPILLHIGANLFGVLGAIL